MAIAEIHKEIIQTHILTRLDGQTLSSAACVSSQLRSLCSDDKLWSDICSSNWPSTDHPLVRQAISDFPSGHRSFFSDSFPSPSHRLTTTTTTTAPHQIISAVDLRYHGELVFSKAESTNTAPDSDWFRSSPFRIDLLEPKEIVPSAVKFSGDDREMQSDLERNITLSWIVIDPTRNRAVNVSSEKPVSIQRNWLTDDIELTFAVVAAVDNHHDEEHVSCNIEVTCGVKEGSGEVYVSGVGLTVQDLDGKCLSGEGSMVILQGLMVGERRSRRYGGGGGDRKERYEEYVERGRERREERERRERRLDMVCVASGMAFLMAFWSFALW